MHSEFYMIDEEAAERSTEQKKMDVKSSVWEQRAVAQSNQPQMKMES